MTITVTRMYLPDCTIGVVQSGKFRCFSLELPWKENKAGESCIPEGEYSYKKALSPSRGKQVIWLVGVPNRSAIQIHEGNFTRQIQGCILLGDSLKDINGDGIVDVTNSVKTFEAFMHNAPPEGTITIKGSSI